MRQGSAISHCAISVLYRTNLKGKASMTAPKIPERLKRDLLVEVEVDLDQMLETSLKSTLKNTVSAYGMPRQSMSYELLDW